MVFRAPAGSLLSAGAQQSPHLWLRGLGLSFTSSPSAEQPCHKSLQGAVRGVMEWLSPQVTLVPAGHAFPGDTPI